MPFEIQKEINQNTFLFCVTYYILLSLLFSVVIVVFDLTDIETLEHAIKWKADACENAKDPLVFLVGTKKDIVVSIVQ